MTGRLADKQNGKKSLWSIYPRLNLGDKFSEVDWVALLFFLLKFFQLSDHEKKAALSFWMVPSVNFSSMFKKPIIM